MGRLGIAIGPNDNGDTAPSGCGRPLSFFMGNESANAHA